MHWIEDIFHIDPDGGNGMLEAAIFCALLLVAYLAIAWKNARRRAKP